MDGPGRPQRVPRLLRRAARDRPHRPRQRPLTPPRPSATTALTSSCQPRHGHATNGPQDQTHELPRSGSRAATARPTSTRPPHDHDQAPIRASRPACPAQRTTRSRPSAPTSPSSGAPTPVAKDTQLRQPTPPLRGQQALRQAVIQPSDGPTPATAPSMSI